MLHRPEAGNRVYEVSLYNKDVRALVKENRSHSFYEDRWADIQKYDVCARDEADARAKVGRKYTPEDGFVIQSVLPGRF